MRKSVYLLIAALVVSFLLSGCDWLGDALTTVTGTAVNARTTNLDGIDGVAVTFTGGTNPITATTASDGSYTIDYSTEGLYEVTATKTGWFFIPQTIYIGGWLQDVPDLLGIEIVSSTDVSLVLVWNGDYKDLDGHLTYPDGNTSGSGFEGVHLPLQAGLFDSPYESMPAGSTGFGPDSSGREHIYPTFNEASSNTVGAVLDITNSNPAISLDRDDMDGFGPEVITIKTIPFWPSTLTLTDSTLTFPGDGEGTGNHLPNLDGASTDDWTWIGTMDYYVDGWNATTANAAQGTTGDISSTTDSGADAKLYITQGSSIKGVYTVPTYGDFRTVKIARINMFVGTGNVWRLQFVPEVEVTEYASIKSLEGPIAGIFGVGGTIDWSNK
jgi:hypothetical protein